MQTRTSSTSLSNFSYSCIECLNFPRQHLSHPTIYPLDYLIQVPTPQGTPLTYALQDQKFLMDLKPNFLHHIRLISSPDLRSKQSENVSRVCEDAIIVCFPFAFPGAVNLDAPRGFFSFLYGTPAGN